MAKIKYEKPELVELNDKNAVQGICNSGSVNASAKCSYGTSAPSGDCRSGTSAGVSKKCLSGGNR